MLAQPILDKEQLQGFHGAAQVLEHLDKQGQHPASTLAHGGSSELNREGSDTDKFYLSCSIITHKHHHCQ